MLLIVAFLFFVNYFLFYDNLKNRLENGALKALDKTKLCITLIFVLHVPYWGSALNSIYVVFWICGLVLVLDAGPVLGARDRLVQSRCLELVFGEKIVSGVECPVLGKNSSLVRGTLVIS